MYETMSADNLVSTSVRKSNANNFKSNKEDHQNCAEKRIAVTATAIAGTYLEAKGLSPPKATHDEEPQQQDFNKINNNHHNHASASTSTSSASHEMFLQWGMRKRSRCSRTEGRSINNGVIQKHLTTTNQLMPPPNSNNSDRNGSSTRIRAHSLLSSKDTPAFPSSKNRNIVDQMGTNIGSPSRNVGGVGGSSSSNRPISRSTVGKRSPSCIEKHDNSSKKICSTSGGIRKVKSDDSLTPITTASNVNGSHGDQERGGVGGVGHGPSTVCFPGTDAETRNELFEWPRIYISLSRKEKEDDYYAMKGTKLPHRPKKRPKAVDRALQDFGYLI